MVRGNDDRFRSASLKKTTYSGNRNLKLSSMGLPAVGVPLLGAWRPAGICWVRSCLRLGVPGKCPCQSQIVTVTLTVKRPA